MLCHASSSIHYWTHSSHSFVVLAAGQGISGESSLAAHAGVGSVQPVEEGSNASHLARIGKQV